MAKNENSTEIAATLVGIYGTISGAADALGVSVSQVHAWVEGTTSMTRSTALYARRLIDDFRLRAKGMHGMLGMRLAGEEAADVIPLVVERWEIQSGGRLNLLERVMSPLPVGESSGRALELVRDTLTMSVLPDPWREKSGGVAFYGRSGDDLSIIVVYLDDGNPPASKTAWSLFRED